MGRKFSKNSNFEKVVILKMSDAPSDGPAPVLTPGRKAFMFFVAIIVAALLIGSWTAERSAKRECERRLDKQASEHGRVIIMQREVYDAKLKLAHDALDALCDRRVYEAKMALMSQINGLMVVPGEPQNDSPR